MKQSRWSILAAPLLLSGCSAIQWTFDALWFIAQLVVGVFAIFFVIGFILYLLNPHGNDGE
jgi:hypothetical protein